MAPEKQPAAGRPGAASDDVNRCAAEGAAHLDSATGSSATDTPRFERQLDDLINAIRQLDSRFAFDREGRPAALEDHACEIAAFQEALYQIALACGRRVAQRGPRS